MESTLISTPTTTVESLRKALGELGLDTRGHKPELKKRLRKAKKKLAKEEEEDDTKKKGESHTIITTTIPDSLTNNQKVEGQEKEKKEEEEKAFPKQPFDYYLFFDVEATCEEGGSFEYPNEIIEFPIVLVDGRTFEIVCYLPFSLCIGSK